MALAALLLTSSPVWAASIHETYFVDFVPDSSQIADWSKLGGTRSYTFDLGDPDSSALQAIAGLTGADSILMETTAYPGEDSVDAWKSVAALGAEFVSLEGGGPIDDEVERLNRIGFKKCLFVFSFYPDPDESARISRLTCKPAVTFNTGEYPKYVDRPGLDAFPAGMPMLFAVDFWPFYIQMDIFNLMTAPIRLSISGMMPPPDELEYLKNIKRLSDVTVNLDFEPALGSWNVFDFTPVHWSSKDFVPSANALQDFAASGSDRKFTIDSDTDLLPEERTRLEAQPIAIDWIHRPAVWHAE